MQVFSNRVAVLGAGPSGLAAARYLKAHGFEPVIFEQSERLGGQWNAGAEHSGVWAGMHTNTSRVMTRFSDVDYPEETEMFPPGEAVLDYLDRYAAEFALAADLRLNTRIDSVARHPSRCWAVHSVERGGWPRTELFDRVVIAAGRYGKPAEPKIPGNADFTGRGGISHSLDYRGAAAFEDQTVVVAGCSISALEIACQLAKAGNPVVLSSRRQRYIVRKLIGEVPADSAVLTRFAALAGETFPPAEVEAELKELILRSSGDPAEHGCLRPAERVFDAGIALSDDFLELVKSGRIVCKPWLDGVTGRTAHFADGSSVEADAIVLATGFELDLPYLDMRTRKAIGADLGSGKLDLYDFTFHPDLPGLAFAGLFAQAGPYFPVVELQARWIAYTWAGLVPPVAAEVMRAEMQAPEIAHEPLGHDMALRFARNAGVEPNLAEWPGLARALLFGPLSPVSFRLSGPDSLPGAGWDVMTEAARSKAILSPVMTGEERASIQALVSAGRSDLAWLLSQADPVEAGQRRAA